MSLFPPTRSFTVNKHTFEMIFVEGDIFMMGSEENDAGADSDEKPAHKVSVLDYYLGKYPVTQGLWKAVMGEENNPSFFQGDLRPVERVSWDEAKDFIEKLNTQTGLIFRLPSEAEWEFAARGGNKSKHTVYSGSNRLEEVGWYRENSHRETKPVGQKLPNELGLYDMSGNVWEWCEDDWHNNYRGAPADGSAWIDAGDRGSDRVRRGGSWLNASQDCRVAYRRSDSPVPRGYTLGFRLAFAPPV